MVTVVRTGNLTRRADPGRGVSGSRGFTLLEMIIVLVILVMLVAITWPALRRPMLRSATQEAARQLVRDLARARMEAIDSAQIMMWRFEPGGVRYVVAPAATLSNEDPSGVAVSVTTEEDNDSDNDSDNGSSTGSADLGDAPADVGFVAQLEKDVVFGDPADQPDDSLPPGSALRDMLEDERQETEEVKPLIDPDQSAQDLSTPVFFYPTGRAENAEFVLQGPDGYRVKVKLRGLTGAASIGPLEHPLRDNRAADQSGREPDRPTDREEPIEPDVRDP